MKRLLKTYLYRAFVSRRFAEQAAAAVLMSLLGAVLVSQLSVMMKSGQLPQGTLSGLRTGSCYTLGAVRFGSVMQLRLLRTKDFITGLLCTEGMLTLIAVACVRSTSGELRFGGAANAVSRGAKRSQVFAAMCVSNAAVTAALSLICVLTFAVFTQIPAAGFRGGGIADIEDVGILLRQLTELVSFAVMCTAVTLLTKKPLRSVLTLMSAVFVLPPALGYMKLMYGTDLGLPKMISYIRLLQSGLLLPGAGDGLAAAGMLLGSAAAGNLLIRRMRIEI